MTGPKMDWKINMSKIKQQIKIKNKDQLNNRDEPWNKKIQINIHLLAEIKCETINNKGINKPPTVVKNLPLKNATNTKFGT